MITIRSNIITHTHTRTHSYRSKIIQLCFFFFVFNIRTLKNRIFFEASKCLLFYNFFSLFLLLATFCIHRDFVFVVVTTRKIFIFQFLSSFLLFSLYFLFLCANRMLNAMPFFTRLRSVNFTLQMI